MTSRRYWFLLLGCLAIGLFLRLWQLGDASYWIDESYSIALAESIAQHGWPITEAGYLITRSVLYHYILAGILSANGGVSAVALRLPAVWFGLGAMVAVAAVARQLFSQRVALITAAMMSVSVWEIAWSRQVRMYTAWQLATWLTIYFYLRYRKRASLFNLVWLCLGVGLTIGMHELGIIIIALLAMHYGVERLFKQRFTWQRLMGASLVFMALLGMAATIMHYGFGFAVVNYWPNYWYYIVTTIPITFGLAAISLFSNRVAAPVPTVWLASTFIFTVGIFSFAIELLQYRYIFFMLPAVFMLGAITVDALWSLKGQKRVWSRVLIICLGIVAIMLGEYSVWPKSFYVLESDVASSPFTYKSITPQPNFAVAYEYIASVTKPTDSVLTAYPTVQNLYAPEHTHSCLYVDLTGTAPSVPTTSERYTACPYVTTQTLCTFLQAGQGYVLLDQFARQRIDPTQQELITNYTTVEHTITAGLWSNITLYRPAASTNNLDCHNLAPAAL